MRLIVYALTCMQVLLSNICNGQIVVTMAGTGVPGYSGDGGIATDAKLYYPYSVKPDNNGNWYIADNYNHVIRKINSAGIISTVVGNGYNAGSWEGGYSGDGGPALNASLSKPADVAFDRVGNMYIAENGNAIIRKVSTSGIVSTIAGIAGSPGYTGDGGPATSAQIANPIGLVFDTIGNLYFSNNGKNCIRKIDLSGNITTVVGTGIAGFNGDGGPATSAKVRLTGFIAFDGTGNLIVPDYKNHRIRKVDKVGIISTIVGTGALENSGDGFDASLAGIGEMCSVVYDQLGNLFLSDCVKSVVRKIGIDGIITTIAGTGVAGFNGDGAALSTQFATEMHGTAIDNWGNLYIADPFNHRIRKIVFNVGVNDISNSVIKVLVNPNPTSTEIRITANQPIKEMVVLNMLGQALMKVNPNRKETTLAVSHFPAGIYIVKANGVYAGQFVKE